MFLDHCSTYKIKASETEATVYVHDTICPENLTCGTWPSVCNFFFLYTRQHYVSEHCPRKGRLLKFLGPCAVNF